MQQANSVRIRTNESNLIARLGTVFSNSNKVLSEMMQNARRARATEIRFDYEGNSLTVIDNGTGIDDMQKLLTIAESGWDSETIRSESAFGAGFMSVVYSCE